jgi:hypothetical protein
LGLHLRSFVTATKTQPSLNHNLKSVPLVLTADRHRLLSESGGRRLTQADVLTVVLALTGIGSVVFRKTARARIG